MKIKIFRLMAAAICVSVSVPMLQGNGFTQKSEEQRLPVIKYVEPEFPSGMHFHGVTSGHAVVAIAVNKSGQVIDAYSTEFSHKQFADSSIAAIKNWVFEPAESNSQLPRFFPVRVNFRMEGVILVITSVEDSQSRHDRLVRAEPAYRSFPIENLDNVPQQTHAPLPKYPEELKSEKKKGLVEVQFYIDSSGRVRVPFVRQSDDPLFSEAALEAVRNWSFASPKRNGRPVSAFAVQEFSFGPRPMLN